MSTNTTLGANGTNNPCPRQHPNRATHPQAAVRKRWAALGARTVEFVDDSEDNMEAHALVAATATDVFVSFRGTSTTEGWGANVRLSPWKVAAGNDGKLVQVRLCQCRSVYTCSWALQRRFKVLVWRQRIGAGIAAGGVVLLCRAMHWRRSNAHALALNPSQATHVQSKCSGLCAGQLNQHCSDDIDLANTGIPIPLTCSSVSPKPHFTDPPPPRRFTAASSGLLRASTPEWAWRSPRP